MLNLGKLSCIKNWKVKIERSCEDCFRNRKIIYKRAAPIGNQQTSPAPGLLSYCKGLENNNLRIHIVLIVNAFFVVLFAGSAMFFQRVSTPRSGLRF